MKKAVLFIIAIFAISFGTNAQERIDKAEFNLYQSLYGMEKKSVVLESLDLAFNEEQEFVAMYDAYIAERQDLVKALVSNLNTYNSIDMNSTDEEVSDLIDSTIKSVSKNRTKLKAIKYKYYKRIKKELGVPVASQFLIVENYFDNLLNISIVESLPFIEDQAK